MNEILQARHNALARALETNIKHIFQTQQLDFSIMEQEFIKQGYREDQSSGIENILIFRLDYMGDFILTTPVIREIRANYPYAFITLVVNKAVYPMAELCPYVNEVIPIEVDYGQLVLNQDIQGMLMIASNVAAQYLWKRNYTLCICLRHQIDLIDLFLNYLSGAKKRVGHIKSISYPYEGDPTQKPNDIANYFLTQPIVHPKEIMHTCAKNLYLLKAMGLQIRQTNAELWYDAEDLYTARKLLEGFAPNHLKIIAGIGANHPARKYPIEKYLAAFKLIVKKSGSLVIIGGSQEVEDAKFLEKNLPKESVKNFVDMKLSWRITASIISQSDMYIGNDSGTIHIAAAENIPTIKISRESKDSFDDEKIKGFLSEYTLFFPWQTNSINIRPKHALGTCKNKTVYGGCAEWKPHCITQIDPKEIVDAYETFAKLIKSSGIKRTSCPTIMRSVNQVPQLYSNLINP
ncbi:MAG: glycosyltransferase family 9 protein [Selenomonadaceae bacterium]|nr:glycosyltransferase family 9 protein [Selenomonadaceae bacterium]